jgi:hypothetical protein
MERENYLMKFYLLFQMLTIASCTSLINTAQKALDSAYTVSLKSHKTLGKIARSLKTLW